MLLVDDHPVDDTTVRELVVSLELLGSNLLLQFGWIVVLHQCLNGCLALLIGSNILRLHKLRTELVAVKTSREVPLVGIEITLEGMTVSDFLTVDGHHLRLTTFRLLLFLRLLLGCLSNFLFWLLNLGLLIDLRSLGLDLGLFGFGLLFLGFCFFLHVVGLFLVISYGYWHIDNGNTIASTDQFRKTDIKLVVGELCDECPILLEPWLLCVNAEYIREFLCILVQSAVLITVTHENQRIRMLTFEVLVLLLRSIGLVLG